MTFKYFSAFAGIGGFDLGINQVIPDAECIGYSEVNKYAIKIYEKHFPDNVNYGNIQKIDTETLPDFDGFCGGFPCQDLSIAGKRAGLCGARSGLFFEIIRIIREKQPRIVFLENVKGLFSSNRGWDFARIITELDESGYDIEWQCLNSKNFGVPQNRERVFIIGHLRGKPWKSVFPLTENNRQNDGIRRTKETEGAWIPCLNSRYGQRWSGEGYIRTGCKQISGTHQGNRVYSTDGLSKCLSDGGGQGAKTGLIVHNMQPRSPNRPSAHNGGSGHLTRDDGITYCLDSTPQRIEVAPTIRAEHHNTADVHFINSGSKIRRLTPLESERLQGFPDGWTAIGSDNKPISDSQRYKCLGNAVTVNVITAIMQKLNCNIRRRSTPPA